MDEDEDDDLLQRDAKRPCLAAIEPDVNVINLPTHIHSLIADCLTLITDYLDAHSLMHLVWTGNKSFLNNIFRVAKRFMISELPLANVDWPSIIPHFRHLNTISIDCKTPKYGYSRAELDKFDIFSVPSSLTSLSLSNMEIQFDASSKAMLETNTPLSQALAQLQTLTLHNIRLTEQHDVLFLSNIVSKCPLQRLRLSGTYGHHDQFFFDNIPSTLSSLSIDCCMPGVDMSKLSLTRLRACIHLDTSPTVKLPPTLTVLSLFEDLSCDDVITVPLIPPSLIKLKLNCPEYYVATMLTEWHLSHPPIRSVKTVVLVIPEGGAHTLSATHAKAICAIFPEANRLTIDNTVVMDHFERRTAHSKSIGSPRRKEEGEVLDDTAIDYFAFIDYLAYDLHSIWTLTHQTIQQR